MAKKKEILLGRRRIAEIAAAARQDDNGNGDIVVLAQMAGKYRQAFWATKRSKKRKPKKYLKSTDYLTVEEFTRVSE